MPVEMGGIGAALMLIPHPNAAGGVDIGRETLALQRVSSIISIPSQNQGHLADEHSLTGERW
jgi:hypothetical protein